MDCPLGRRGRYEQQIIEGDSLVSIARFKPYIVVFIASACILVLSGLLIIFGEPESPDRQEGFVGEVVVS